MKKIGLNSLIYILSDVLVKSIPFLLMPIISAYLTIEEYGRVSLFQSALEIATIIVMFGGHQFFRYEYFKRKGLRWERWFILPIINSGLIALLLMFIFFSVTKFFAFNGFYLFIPIAAFFQSIVSIFILKYQNEEKPKVIALVSGLLSFISLLLSILLLYLEFGLDGRLTAIVLAPCIIGLSFLARINTFSKGIDFQLDKLKRDLFKVMFFGVKFLPTSISWWLRSGFDRLVLQYFLGAAAVGTFSVVMQISLVMMVVGNAINNAIMPSLFRNVNQGLHNENFKLIAAYFCLMSVVGVGCYLVLPVVFRFILPASYSQALDYMDVALLGVLFHSCYLIISNLCVALSLSGKLSAVSVLTSILHVSMSIYFVPTNGISGVIFSAVISYLAGVLLILLFIINSTREAS